MQPVVSVIVPNYNYGRYLRQRLDSILAQTFQDFELIILDDASTDDSARIIREYEEVPQVSHIEINAENSGSTFRQWNKGAHLARGKYLWFAEADDWSVPEFLERLTALLETHPEAVMAYCQSWMINDWKRNPASARQYTDDLDTGHWKQDFTATGAEEAARYLVHKNTIVNASAVLIRRATYLAVGGAPEDMKYMGDWLTWLRLLARGGMAYSAEHLNYFRFHAGSVRHAHYFHPRYFQERYRVLAFTLKHFPVSRSECTRARNAVCAAWLEQLLGIGGKAGKADFRLTWPAARKADPVIGLRLAWFLLRVSVRCLRDAGRTDQDMERRELVQGLFRKYVAAVCAYYGSAGEKGAPQRIALCGRADDVDGFLKILQQISPAPVIEVISGITRHLAKRLGTGTVPVDQIPMDEIDACILVSHPADCPACRRLRESQTHQNKIMDLHAGIPRVPLSLQAEPMHNARTGTASLEI